MALHLNSAKDFAALEPHVLAKLAEAGIHPPEASGGQQAVGPWRPHDPKSKDMLRQRARAALALSLSGNHETCRTFLNDMIESLT